jgi:hypothetical protein
VDDGTDCTFDGVSGVCVSGVCGDNLCEGVVCEDDGNECTDDVCNFADGTCNVPDGTSCNAGACLDGACTALTTVGGEVFLNTNSERTPAVGATVSVVGTSLSTTTDDDGKFSFDVFPGGWFFQASKEDTWGYVSPWTVPTSVLLLRVWADEVMTHFEQELGVDIDETKGNVWMDFYPGASYLGGETATFSESYDFASTFDANGSLVLSEKLLPDGDSTLQFFNMDLTEELTVTPVGVEGVNTCRLDKPGIVYPVMAKSVTFVSPICEPL